MLYRLLVACGKFRFFFVELSGFFSNIFDPCWLNLWICMANCTLLDSDVIQDDSYFYSDAVSA